MPPLIDSSDEESMGDAIPFHSKEDNESQSNADDDGSQADDKDDGDESEEPEDVDGAKEALDEYFKKIGGQPEQPEKTTKKRKSLAERAASTPDKPPAKRGRKKGSVDDESQDAQDAQDAKKDGQNDLPDWVPGIGKDWDKELDSVSTIIRDPETKVLFAFLEWKNGKKTKVSLNTCYERCPMKMLQFYEQHLYVF
ncbi:heterochromatin protein HP1 [Arthroderma uncinatum]|uniref:heterochromatin protein HP1 n=1 Tax=Arthroderma uncinatum TaxID=74035 RepID=UPI00144A802C|nr:heterochromatin protein HP1 [Arthroderma uncinatum]KAF3491327.1 heterochromatin protein HP1 [Arthroderma uncinatum]